MAVAISMTQLPTKADHQRINATSGCVDYYTPKPIIDAARKTMGSIDLDPASSLAANNVVRATRYFTKDDDGLTKRWDATAVYMNHPFGRGLNGLWINKLLSEFKDEHFSQACCITYACTSESWFQPLLDYPQCFLCPRTSYILPDGTPLKGNTKGSVVTYLGPMVGRFSEAFGLLGKIKVVYPLKKLCS